MSIAEKLEENGFAVYDKPIFCLDEINAISAIINKHFPDQSSDQVFAIRQLLRQIPELKPVLFNATLINLLAELFPNGSFLSKAIYFDKPAHSNWFVAYHQDLSISVDRKAQVLGYDKWTQKHGQFGVIPPVEILQHTSTIRIHLDKTDRFNGALRVLPQSHKAGISNVQKDKSTEVYCELDAGEAMLMKPLTMHASDRTTNNQRRRVLHLEFCDRPLAAPLDWLEKMAY